MDYKKRNWIMGVLTLINKRQHTTRGVSNVGDVMTSNQQNPQGGAPNGG
jgi:hypothetical protein